MAKMESKEKRGPRVSPSIVVFWLVVASLVLLGGSRIRLDVNPLRILPQSLPEVQGLSAFLERFSRPDELILAIDGPDPATVKTAADSLARRLRERTELAGAVIDQPPGEGDPQSMSQLMAHLLANQPPAQMQALAADLAPGRSGARIQATIERMTFDLSPAVALLGAYDPLRLVEAAFGSAGGTGGDGLLGGVKFGSEDGKLQLIYLWAPRPLARQDYRELIRWTSAVRSDVQEWRQQNDVPPSVRVRLTGEPAIMAEVSASMQSDLMGSGLSASLLVSLIFWAVYRRITPLLAILAMLTLVTLMTFGFSGLIVGDLNAMNVGFGAILIGLTVDYAILIYQQSLVTPGDPRAIRKGVFTGIAGAALTTAACFAALHAGSQPSLAALGSIVVIGTVLAAGLMLWMFVPWSSRISASSAGPVPPPAWLFLSPTLAPVMAILVALAIPLAITALAWKGWPTLDASDRATRPRVSEGYDALDDLQRALTGSNSSASLVVTAPTSVQLREKLEALRAPLQAAVTDGRIRSFFLPAPFVPVERYRFENAEDVIPQIVQGRDRFKGELNEAGFEPTASMLLDQILERLSVLGEDPSQAPAMSDGAKWLLQRLIRLEPDGSAWASVPIEPQDGADLTPLLSSQVYLADWHATTRAIRDRLPAEFGRIFSILLALSTAILLWTFRRVEEMLWTGLSLVLSSIITLGVMSLAGWTWNFVNSAAILICLGAGADYSIHMLLAMRKGQAVSEALADTGRAILVCALTTVAGFGSLTFASNLGLASLGQVCALALGANCLVATYVLPYLWRFVHARELSPS
ncbi:MAG: putative exporter [Verrucomicrobia bacterium]|nr:MAG: putative exporter [Verrucomicrobiota bacterium]